MVFRSSLKELLTRAKITFTHISWFADRFGRKTSLYLAWLWLAAGWAFFNGAKTPAVWALGKLCTGAGIGVLQVVCQIYVMEVSPNRIRGGLIVFQAVWSQLGGIIVSVMVQQLNQKHPEDYLIVMRIVWGPIALMLLLWAIIPESPWYYSRRGNKAKALKMMKSLYGGVPGYDFEEEYGIIQRTLEHEKQVLQEAPKWVHIFKGLNLVSHNVEVVFRADHLQKRTLTVAVLAIAQQLVGLSIIFTYSTYFFSLAGLQDPFLGTVILSCVNLLAVILWSLTADKVGRRITICTAETACVCILFAVGGLYWSGATTGAVSAGTALLVICCIWTFLFQIIGMSYFVYSAELPAAVLRMKTAPATFFTNSIFGIATNYATPPMLLTLGLRTGFVYGAFSVPIAIFLWLYLPETKGRSAAEIDELYERKISAWRWSKTTTVAEEQMRAVIGVRGGVESVQA